MTRKILTAFAGLMLLAATGPVARAADKKPAAPAGPQPVRYGKEEMEAALATAKAFIGEVDKDDGRTWEFFSPLAQQQTTESQWKMALYTLKAICGAVVNRGNLRATCYDALPDAPPGRYFIFDMDAKFERLAMTERIVLLKEGAGWKVAGYFRNKRAP